MHAISVGIVAAASTLFGFMGTSNAGVNTPDTILVAGIGHLSPVASLAWTGEDETLSSLRLGDSLIAMNDGRTPDTDLMVAIATPEPPAIVLAGGALGGLLCYRSSLRKRHATAGMKNC